MQTTTPAPVLPPPQMSLSLPGWLRANLFSPWYNALLTVLLVVGLGLVAGPLWRWLFVTGHWHVVAVNLRLFMVGLYPSEQLWRPGVLLIMLAWPARWEHGAPSGYAAGCEYNSARWARCSLLSCSRRRRV